MRLYAGCVTDRKQSPWPGADLSGTDFQLEDSAPTNQRRDETGPLATIPVKSATSDGAKIAAGAGGGIAFLALIDSLIKNLSSTGMTAADVTEHLGPALGVLYNSSPVVACMVGMGVLLVKGYRSEQDHHRRHNRRLQRAISALGESFTAFGLAIKQEVTKLRGDVNGLNDTLATVRKDVEAQITSAVTNASRAVGDRVDRNDAAIAELRATTMQHGPAIVELRAAQVVMEKRGDPRAHAIVSPHTPLEPATPATIRRPGRQR